MQLAQRFSVAMAEASEARAEARQAATLNRDSASDIARFHSQSEHLRLQTEVMDAGIADLRREVQAQRSALGDVSRDFSVVCASGAGPEVRAEITQLRTDMVTSRLLSAIEGVEGGPRADEVDLWENTKILKVGISKTQTIQIESQKKTNTIIILERFENKGFVL